MPLVDPFRHDCYFHEFQASSLMIRLTHPLAIPIRMDPLPQEPSQEPLAPPCVLRVASAYPGCLESHPEAVSERVGLTSDQASVSSIIGRLKQNTLQLCSRPSMASRRKLSAISGRESHGRMTSVSTGLSLTSNRSTRARPNLEMTSHDS